MRKTPGLAVLILGTLLAAPVAQAKPKKSAKAPPMTCVDEAAGGATPEVARVCHFTSLPAGALIGPLVVTRFVVAKASPVTMKTRRSTGRSAATYKLRSESLTSGGPFYLPHGWSLTTKARGVAWVYTPAGITEPPPEPVVAKAEKRAKKPAANKRTAKSAAKKSSVEKPAPATKR